MFRIVIRLSRPHLLLLAALAYLLGAGIARYLGFSLKPLSFWLGLGWVLLLSLSALWLAEFFRPFGDLVEDNEPPYRRAEMRRLLLLFSGLALVFLGALAALLVAAGQGTPAVIFALLLTFVFALAYGLPPLRLIYSGYGELLQALFLADLIPVLAYLLQAGEFNRLLPAVVFPLTLLTLSYFLALGFSSYAADQRYNRCTLVRRLGWQRAIDLHRVFVLLAYLLFALAPLTNLPIALFWPVFLTLPLALLQMYWFSRIAAGAPPLWRFFDALSLALLGLVIYVLSLTFWIR